MHIVQHPITSEAMPVHKFLSPPYIIGASFVATYTTAAWIWRGFLIRMTRENQDVFAALMSAFAAFLISYLATHKIEDGLTSRQVVLRTEEVTGLYPLRTASKWKRLRSRIPNPVEWIAKHLGSTRYGQVLRQDLVDLGWGTKLSRVFTMMLISTLFVGWAGMRMAGWLLAISLALTAFLLLRSAMSAMANTARRRLALQIPHILESLASGMSAGLSFQQSVAFASNELPEPSAGLMQRLKFRMDLGHPVEVAVRTLTEAHSEEALALAIDGIILQRQFGGDLIAHLEEAAALLHERLELEQEVRSITAQGRLSGWVVGALVPVSAVILLTFNPQYINILFDTFIGQLVLVTVILLQLVGWALISRLIRIRY
jgi:tight adherence protein B